MRREAWVVRKPFGSVLKVKLRDLTPQKYETTRPSFSHFPFQMVFITSLKNIFFNLLVIIRLIPINLRPESYNQTNITMKKVFAVLAIVGMTSFVACGPKAEEATTEATEATTEVEATTTEATEAVEATVDTAAAATGAVVDSAAATVAQ
jgi:hypothetical protein